MEKSLSRNELLTTFLRQAENPFTSMEQKADIKRILEESTTMRGMNHLYLVQCYFEEDHPLFYVTEEEALTQAQLALKENNRGAYFYLYKLYRDKDEVKARNYLRLSCWNKNPYAYLEMGKLRKDGILFKKNREEAYRNFEVAARCGLEEGYFNLLLMASEDHDYEKEKKIYRTALVRGISLPGVVQ